MRAKILVVAVALVLGGLAAVLAANYLTGAQSEIASDAETVVVLVAQEDLPRGLTAAELVERGLVLEEEIPRRFVSSDAVSSERALENQVLAVPVSAGEQLTKTRFQYPSQAGLSYSVPEDFVAVSIDVDDVSGVAGLLKPGDNVVAYATFVPLVRGTEEDEQSTDPFTMTVVPRARVLAIGEQISAEPASDTDADNTAAGALAANSAANQGTSNGSTYRSVTLALSVEDAERIVFAQEQGMVHFALLPKNAEEPPAPAPTTLGSVKATTLKSILD